MAKFIICLFVAALAGCAVAQLLPISGTRDLTGGYYDHYTGQYSSALTGRVYNTAPVVAAAPAIAAAPALLAPQPALLAPHAIAAAPAVLAAPAAAIAHPAYAAPAFAWLKK